MRRWRLLPLAFARLRARRSALARGGVLHELDAAHARARVVGRGGDACRRRPARARAREARRAGGGRSRSRSRSSSALRRSSSTSRTPGSSRGRRSSTTRSVGRCSSQRSSRSGRFCSRAARLARRVRGDVDRARGDAVLRSGCRADLRPPLRPRRWRPVRQLARRDAHGARAPRYGASAHATLVGASPADAVATRRRAAAVVLRFDQTVTRRHGDRRLLCRRTTRLRTDGTRRRTAALSRRRCEGLGGARPTRCGGGRRRPTGTRAPASTRSASA